MFRAIMLLGVAAVVMFMAGWFTVDRNSEETTIRFNRDEIRADTSKAIAKGRDLLQKTRESNGAQAVQGQADYGQPYNSQQPGTSPYGTQQYGTQQYSGQAYGNAPYQNGQYGAQPAQSQYQQTDYQNYPPPAGYQPSQNGYAPQQAQRPGQPYNQPQY